MSPSSYIVRGCLPPSLLVRLTDSQTDIFKAQDTTTCSNIFKIGICSFYVGIALAKSCVSRLPIDRLLTAILSLLVILTLRTWAVWDRGRKLGFGLVIFFVVCWGSIVPFTVLFIRDLECEKTYFQYDLHPV